MNHSYFAGTHTGVVGDGESVLCLRDDAGEWGEPAPVPVGKSVPDLNG